MAISNSNKIWFSAKPTKDGVYRYDIVINGVTVFVGNTYLIANQNPIIDIASVLKQFVDVNEPPFSAIGEMSGVYKNIDVKLYLGNNVYTNSITQFFIYENPNFNSDISTPILSNLLNADINSMPMLQGWDYLAKKGYLLPTYPTVASDDFTFDFVGGYQNSNFTNILRIRYKDDLMGEPETINITGGACYQYSIPLGWLLRGVADGGTYVFDAITDLFNMSSFGSSYSISDRLDEVEEDAYLVRVYNNGSTNPKSVVNQYSIIHYVTGIDEVVEFNTIGDTDGADNYYLEYEFTNILNVASIDVYMVYADSNQDILTISPNIANWKIINENEDINQPDSFSLSLSMKPNGEYPVNENITITTEVIRVNRTADVCDALDLEIGNVVSNSQSVLNYDYKIANFDSKSRYFLKWKDRYGMPMVQPFGGTYKYGEDITKNTITNHLNTRKIVDITTKSKWLLNTKWIKQEFYPFYESIFVSPYLILYDAKEDKQYNVILTNTEYEEKTFNNQNRQLFNLQLTVELDTSETMVY